MGGLRGGDVGKLVFGSGGPAAAPKDEPVVGGLMDLRFGALALAKTGLRSFPNRSPKANVVGDGELRTRSGVRLPIFRWRASVSIRDRAEDCWSWRSWVSPCSYSRRVRVTFLSSTGVVAADDCGVEVDCQSLIDRAGGWDVTEVAAVEFRAMAEADEVVEDVSRLRL
jgi:hypothetical protein